MGIALHTICYTYLEAFVQIIWCRSQAPYLLLQATPAPPNPTSGGFDQCVFGQPANVSCKIRACSPGREITVRLAINIYTFAVVTARTHYIRVHGFGAYFQIAPKTIGVS